MNHPRQKRMAAAVALGAMLAGQFEMVPPAYADEMNRDREPAFAGREQGEKRTATPIEHVIVFIGENRSFDHVFATYRPRRGQSVSNLLSRGIVNADGTPGMNFAFGTQFTVPPQPEFYIGAASKTAYAILPPPDTLGTPTATRNTAPPFTSLAIAAVEKDLEVADLGLLITGASGLPTRSVDTRVLNATALPLPPGRCFDGQLARTPDSPGSRRCPPWRRPRPLLRPSRRRRRSRRASGRRLR